MIFSVISSVLIIISIVCLFGLTPERVTDDLMRLITPNDTMRDKSRNLRGNKKKHRLYRTLVKMKTALAVTGKSKQFTIVCCASLILFAAGIIVSVLIDNIFLMPVLSVAFALIPFFYTTSTLSYYEKNTKEELETALSIITTSYVRSDDIVAAVRENIKYIKPPLRDVFKSFEGEATAISSNIKRALYKLKNMVDNEIFWEWCDTLIQCQDDRTLKDTLLPIVAKLTDVRIVNSELKTMLSSARNRANGKNTFIIIDEIYLLFQHEYSANFLFTLWKRVRKYGAFCTGITQNVDDLLQSHTARTMLANSEFVIMLNQASTDRIKLAELLNISDTQLSYITNVEAGRGLMKVGSALVPFVNKFPKNTKLYALMTTKFGER